MASMNAEQLREAVIDSVLTVAPEADLESLRADRPLRDQLDIDSFDFLNMLVALHERTGIEIPEADYARVSTLDKLLGYLGARIGAAAG